MNIEPTKIEDIYAINPRDESDMEWREFLHGVADRNTLEQYVSVYCRTLRKGDKIIAIAGVTSLWPGVGEIWICIDKDAGQVRFSLTRKILELIPIARDILDAHRLQITVHPDRKEFMEFLLHIGFDSEGPVHSYIRYGEDYQMFYQLFPPHERLVAA